MPAKRRFNARDWLAAAPRTRLDADTFAAVSDFAIIWSIFENLLCNNAANVRVLDALAKRLGPTPQAIWQGLDYWRNRYWSSENGFNGNFESLNFRDSERDAKERVKRVLSEEDTGDSDRNAAALLIVWRLRNNLFHGLKALSDLDDQIGNFDFACEVMAAYLQQLHSLEFPTG